MIIHWSSRYRTRRHLKLNPSASTSHWRAQTYKVCVCVLVTVWPSLNTITVWALMVSMALDPSVSSFIVSGLMCNGERERESWFHVRRRTRRRELWQTASLRARDTLWEGNIWKKERKMEQSKAKQIEFSCGCKQLVLCPPSQRTKDGQGKQCQISPTTIVHPLFTVMSRIQCSRIAAK